MLKKIIPFAIGAALLTICVIFGENSMNSGQFWLYRPFLGVAAFASCAYGLLSAWIDRKIPAKEMAKEMARLLKNLMNEGINYAVFIFEDGWWQLACFTNAGDENIRKGQWTKEEVEGMIEGSTQYLLENSKLKKCFLPKNVEMVEFGTVEIEGQEGQTVMIEITYR